MPLSLKYGNLILINESKWKPFCILKNLSSKLIDILLILGTVKYFDLSISFKLSSENFKLVNLINLFLDLKYEYICLYLLNLLLLALSN